MAIPGYENMMLPLLKHAADGEVHTIRGLKNTVRQQFQPTEDDLAHMLPSGHTTTFHNRLGWAKTYLQRAGLLENIRRGQFVISQRGREVLGDPPEKIDSQFLSQYPEFLEFKRKSGTGDSSSGKADDDSTDEHRTPEEALQVAYKQLRDDLASEILTQIKGMSPQFFEKFVLDLMFAMGYGGVQNQGMVTGRGSDEGIDGVINEDRLGLDIVYLQAKRWANSVSRSEIQKFVGALHGQRARKGVFLTTSTFSREAHDYVATIEPKVVLIDGQRLAQLMIDVDVGVSTTEKFFGQARRALTTSLKTESNDESKLS